MGFSFVGFFFSATPRGVLDEIRYIDAGALIPLFDTLLPLLHWSKVYSVVSPFLIG